jgi:hypothetical protein
MKNLKLTKWLEIVWDALAEQDEAKRTSMLHAADRFLKKEDNQQSAVLRSQQCVISEKSAA